MLGKVFSNMRSTSRFRGNIQNKIRSFNGFTHGSGANESKNAYFSLNLWNEFCSIYEKTYKKIYEANEKSDAEGKILSVIIGDVHNSKQSLGVGLLIFDIAESLKIKHVAIEVPPERVKSGMFEIRRDCSVKFLLNTNRNFTIVPADLDLNSEQMFFIRESSESGRAQNIYDKGEEINNDRESCMVENLNKINAPHLAIFGLLHINGVAKKIEEQSTKTATLLINTAGKDYYSDQNVNWELNGIHNLKRIKEVSESKSINHVDLSEASQIECLKYSMEDFAVLAEKVGCAVRKQKGFERPIAVELGYVGFLQNRKIKSR